MYDPRSKEVFFSISFEQNTCRVELNHSHPPNGGTRSGGGVLKLCERVNTPSRGRVDNSLESGMVENVEVATGKILCYLNLILI